VSGCGWQKAELYAIIMLSVGRQRQGNERQIQGGLWGGICRHFLAVRLAMLCFRGGLCVGNSALATWESDGKYEYLL